MTISINATDAAAIRAALSPAALQTLAMMPHTRGTHAVRWRSTEGQADLVDRAWLAESLRMRPRTPGPSLSLNNYVGEDANSRELATCAVEAGEIAVLVLGADDAVLGVGVIAVSDG